MVLGKLVYSSISYWHKDAALDLDSPQLLQANSAFDHWMEFLPASLRQDCFAPYQFIALILVFLFQVASALVKSVDIIPIW